jgi:hypothetical protein
VLKYIPKRGEGLQASLLCPLAEEQNILLRWKFASNYDEIN